MGKPLLFLDFYGVINVQQPKRIKPLLFLDVDGVINVHQPTDEHTDELVKWAQTNG